MNRALLLIASFVVGGSLAGLGASQIPAKPEPFFCLPPHWTVAVQTQRIKDPQAIPSSKDQARLPE